MDEIKKLTDKIYDLSFFLNEYCKMNPNSIDEVGRISTVTLYLFNNIDRLKYLLEDNT